MVNVDFFAKKGAPAKCVRRLKLNWLKLQSN